MFSRVWYRRRSNPPCRAPSLALSPSGAISSPLHGVDRRSFPWRPLGARGRFGHTGFIESVGQATVTSSQNASWYLNVITRELVVATLRKVIAGLSGDGVPPPRAWWLSPEVAGAGVRLSRRPQAGAGRGSCGLMLPIRGEACYREGATATVSVHDRKGRRLGTVYLGRMPEPGQETLWTVDGLDRGRARWNGPLPRLAYITDGNHQPSTSAGSQADATSTTPRSAAEVRMGDRLLSRE